MQEMHGSQTPQSRPPAHPTLDVPREQRRAALQTNLRLHWQSRLILLLVLPTSVVWSIVLLLRLGSTEGTAPLLLRTLGPATALALLVWRKRSATMPGALTGGLLMAGFCLTTPGLQTSAWPLLSMLVLTLAATRVGRARKQQLQVGDGAHGRNAAQVAANLGVSVLAGILINAHGRVAALTVLLAALAEAAADTLASELGVALGGTPRLITTLKRVVPGTDGGITLLGTTLGSVGAALVAAVGVLAMQLPWSSGLVAAAAGIVGLLFDSALGATLERKGLLNNDAVNFLSTLAAAILALAVEEGMRR
ncbi:MAG TPA: DUF92 domain-containing protein [Acidobacteriaceae bacterium]